MKISWLCLFTVIDVALTYERKQFEHHILVKRHIRKTRWVLLGLQAFQQQKATSLAAMFYVMFHLYLPLHHVVLHMAIFSPPIQPVAVRSWISFLSGNMM